MLGITLAAGHGSRLFPLTLEKPNELSLAQGVAPEAWNVNAVPKPLAPIANVPAIASTFRWLQQAGASRIVADVGSIRARFERLLPATPGLKVELAEDVGNAPAILSQIVQRELRAGYRGVILYANADIVSDNDPRPMLAAHQARRPLVSIMSSPIRGTEPRYSSVETEERAPYEPVRSYQHKVLPQEARARKRNASFYVISPEFFDWLKTSFPGFEERENFDLSEHVFPRLAGEGHLFSYRSEAFWRDIGTLDDYYDVQRCCLDDRSGHPKSGYCYPGSGAYEVAGYTVHGPALIAEKAVIGSGSVIGPYTVIGNGWSIGRNAVLEASVFWPGRLGAEMPQSFFSVADHCAVRRCIVGSGTITQDYQDAVVVHNGSKTVATRLR